MVRRHCWDAESVAMFGLDGYDQPQTLWWQSS